MEISKLVEKFIQEHTRNYSNEIIVPTQDGNTYTKGYNPWLTTEESRKAVDIAREEIYEWLQEHSQEYVYWMDGEFGKDDLINDLKKYLDRN